MVKERLMLPREVAALFGVDRRTVARWANEGRLSSFRTIGGHRRYRESEVLEYAAALKADTDNG